MSPHEYNTHGKKKQESSNSQDHVLTKLGGNIVNRVSTSICELRDEFIIKRQYQKIAG